ncbi:MAG: ABC transporter ATP-binding protein [Pseudomonadota bacterium]
MARIRFVKLEKRYGSQPVLAPLDLEIDDGEFFTFVGPSGCGKSTLLHLIAGVEAPDAGAIYFDDDRVDALAPGARDVAMVFQSYALYPHLTVRENLAFPLRVRRVARAQIEREVAGVAETLGLAALLERKPRALSGGQRQRVALGRALVRRPRVFLMDEPLSNLDARLRLEMREELKRLHQVYRVTTIYVTHDQEEAMALSQRIAVLATGRVQQCGTPQQVYADPENLFVAQFVGSPPLNLLEGEALREIAGADAAFPRHGGEPLLLGVRPADVLVHAQQHAHCLAAEVTLTEPTGSDLWVVGRWRGQRIKGRAAPGARLDLGVTAHFSVPPERVFFFAADSGKRLRMG